MEFYCQYSYLGYRVFLIDLNQAGIPFDSCHDCTLTLDRALSAGFDNACTKLLYRQLPDGRYCLILRDIDSIDLNSDGSAKKCSFQFVAREEEKIYLDVLAVRWLHNPNEIEQQLSAFFYKGSKLCVDCERLRSQLAGRENLSVAEKSWYENHLEDHNSRLLIFVPLQFKYFSTEECMNLFEMKFNIPRDEYIRALFFHYDDLLRANQIFIEKVHIRNTDKLKESGLQKLLGKVRKTIPDVTKKNGQRGRR